MSILFSILGFLAVVSAALGVWQYMVARKFPLHQRTPPGASRHRQSRTPGLSILKPLLGCDEFTKECLQSWFHEASLHPGPVELLFGVCDSNDPVTSVVKELQAFHLDVHSTLVLCDSARGPNAKVGTLVSLNAIAQHPVRVLADADVRIPPDFLVELTQSLSEPHVGCVTCLYRFPNTQTLPMAIEALSVNSDFWSQVLMARSLGPQNFCLGAVIAIQEVHLQSIGGLEALLPYLADDFKLGQLIAAHGLEIALCTLPVDCLEPKSGWRDVWQHQLRWNRTIRSCRPASFAASLISNATLWPMLWLAAFPTPALASVTAALLVLRIVIAFRLQTRMLGHHPPPKHLLLPLAKDILGVGLWAGAFAGHTVVWRGNHFRINGQSLLSPCGKPRSGNLPKSGTCRPKQAEEQTDGLFPKN